MIRNYWSTFFGILLAVCLATVGGHLLIASADATPQDAKPLTIGTRDYVATVERVVDGDTVDLFVEAWPTFILQDRFRLLGINAPETRGAEKIEGKKSTEWLRAKLAPHAQIIVRIPEKRARGKYGRWLGILLVPGEDGKLIDLNTLMVREGFAKVANY